MPTYDYVCNACGHRMELVQSMTEAPKRKCPACGKSRLERLIGMGAGLIFKGSGFYQTDYRSKSYSESAKADQEPAKAGEGQAAKSAEKVDQAKPAASSEAAVERPAPGGGKATDGSTRGKTRKKGE